jgi:hypothetical protein
MKNLSRVQIRMIAVVAVVLTVSLFAYAAAANNVPANGGTVLDDPIPVEPDGGIGDTPIPVEPDGGIGDTPIPVEPDGGIGDGAGPIESES